MLPFVFGALGLAVGAVVGAFTTHAVGESDRQAAKHHRTVANELADKYTNLEQKYYELADKSKKQILGLTRQHALDEVEKDCLRLAVRLQHSLISLMWDIDRDPTEAALKEFVNAVELTNNVLCKINEELICVPSDYYARNLIAAVQREIIGKPVDYPNPPNINKKGISMKLEPKNMSEQEFQETHNRIRDTGDQLLKYLKELRAGRFTEGDSTQGLQSVEDNIAKALKALAEQKYQVAVIAAMKAGKSTFLNAIIGADVLASESESCTVCRTDIRPIDAGQTPRLLEYQAGKREPIVLIEGEASEIRQRFLERTHEIRAKKNEDNTTRFELEHPIEAISIMPSLAGFTLVDTPGPNEWESVSFNTTSLKQTALEALRTCDAILFILDYTSFRDNTNSELLKDLIEQRKEFLAENTGKIYFILNKVDRKAERDRPIADVIESLRINLVEFGIPEPIIYSVSGWQGLLSKLIQQGKATDIHIKDFEDFFSARYAERDERGRRIIPLPEEIAPQSLNDSGIPKIEETVVQTITQNSGWNLLSDVLDELNKAAKAIDETFITDIRGWQLEFEELLQKIEEYKKHSDLAKNQVATVKKSVEAQKQILLSTFSQGINKFAETAKKRIASEIDRVADNQFKKVSKDKKGQNLVTFIWDKFSSILEESSSSDPYKIKVTNKNDAENIGKTINKYCTPIIQSFWLDTQDRLIREATIIREGLVKKIKLEIQAISDELSESIKNDLQVEIGNNPIQFPDFEFSGIDAKIQHQQEVFTRTKKESRKNSRCCESDKVYEVDVSYEEKVSYYEIDLRLTSQGIQQNIDSQVQRNLQLLQRVIEKQVSDDFREGEKQINDYINRFQAEFDSLLKQRATREVEASGVIAILESQRIKVSEYLNELVSIRENLDSWKPRNL
ncbi:MULTISPECIES: dynamin family protein [unclassified Nostoc]|uniref:dynamin family protein n=1 Tax=unclassified Nostoc TaxID=2593658 RepID=UPI0025F39BCF|nr:MULTISPECIES: dynamin family protein [unclassified Nostoc]